MSADAGQYWFDDPLMCLKVYRKTEGAVSAEGPPIDAKKQSKCLPQTVFTRTTVRGIHTSDTI